MIRKTRRDISQYKYEVILSQRTKNNYKNAKKHLSKAEFIKKMLLLQSN